MALGMHLVNYYIYNADFAVRVTLTRHIKHAGAGFRGPLLNPKS